MRGLMQMRRRVHAVISSLAVAGMLRIKKAIFDPEPDTASHEMNCPVWFFGNGCDAFRAMTRPRT
jgi:hypothetical protein